MDNTTIALYSDVALTNVIAFDDNGGYSYNACVSAYLNANATYYFVLSANRMLASGVVTYKIMKGFPVSGSEIVYDTSIWGGIIQAYTNCYSYALNNQLLPDNPDFIGFLQPGMSSYGEVINGELVQRLSDQDYTGDAKKILRYIGYDSQTWGFESRRSLFCGKPLLLFFR